MTTTIELSDTQMNLIVVGLRDLIEKYAETTENFHDIARHLRDGGEYALFATGEAGASAADMLAETFSHNEKMTKALFDLLQEWQFDHTTLSLTYTD